MYVYITKSKIQAKILTEFSTTLNLLNFRFLCQGNHLSFKNTYVYMYIIIYICMYDCMYVFMYVCRADVWYVCACMTLLLFDFEKTSSFTRPGGLGVASHSRGCVRWRVCECACVRARSRVCVRVCACMCVRVCMCMYDFVALDFENLLVPFKSFNSSWRSSRCFSLWILSVLSSTSCSCRAYMHVYTIYMYIYICIYTRINIYIHINV